MHAIERFLSELPDPITTTQWFIGALVGGCGAVAMLAILPQFRKHLLRHFCMVVGIAVCSSVARHFVLGTDHVLVIMLISIGVGSGLGMLGGMFLEDKFRSKARA
jgi:hypothetical protein